MLKKKLFFTIAFSFVSWIAIDTSSKNEEPAEQPNSELKGAVESLYKKLESIEKIKDTPLIRVNEKQRTTMNEARATIPKKPITPSQASTNPAKKVQLVKPKKTPESSCGCSCF